MAEETNTASAATQGSVGHIVRIVGPVVDVEFAPDHMPAIYNALTVKATTPAGDIDVVLEVQMHLPGDLVRSVAMSSTDGLVRGLPVQDTGAPMKMPVDVYKRQDEYFMTLADEVATRTTCLRRAVGAIIVKEKRILATGYNGCLLYTSRCV